MTRPTAAVRSSSPNKDSLCVNLKSFFSWAGVVLMVLSAKLVLSGVSLSPRAGFACNRIAIAGRLFRSAGLAYS